MNLKKRILNWVFRDEYEQIRAVARDAISDWKMIPYTMNRQQGLLDLLGEFDPQMYDLMVRMSRDYQVIASSSANESYRLSLVQQSRSMYLTDPVYKHGVATYTNFGFGEVPNLTAEDENAQAVWDEFWKAKRNKSVLGERRLHKLSDDQVVDGELFFVVFASTVDGEATVRVINPTEIKETIYGPDDKTVPLFYRRDYSGSNGELSSVYYPDWAATPDQLAQAKLPPDAKRADRIATFEGMVTTNAVILHAAFQQIGSRGWPLASTGIDWEREYAGFVKDRAAVARAAASVVEKVKAKGGQRAVDVIRQRLGSTIPGGADAFERNPPPAAGSVWIENEAMDRQWMNRPTNSSDAEKDGIPIITQVGLAFGIFPHYLGRGDYYRLATATAMEAPVLRAFNRYQAFWASVWRDLFEIVIGFKTKYSAMTFSSVDAQVSTDRVITLALSDVTQAIGSLNDMIDRGVIGGTEAQLLSRNLLKTVFETMGIQGINEMLEPAKAAEAGESHSPFAEKASGIDRYRSNLKAAAYGLWSGQTNRDEFMEQFELAIDVGIHSAWAEGMERAGIQQDEFTQDDEIAMADFILEQFSYVSGFADFIEANSKANGGALASIQPRLSMWVNAYNKASGQAFLLADADPLCVWRRGPTEKGCGDCTYADGKCYRKSIWIKWGWATQSPELSCHGIYCLCGLEPAPKGTRANKGHPRRPKGHE